MAAVTTGFYMIWLKSEAPAASRYFEHKAHSTPDKCLYEGTSLSSVHAVILIVKVTCGSHMMGR